MRDTAPEAAAVQARLLRQAGGGRCATLASDLTNACIERAREAISTARPDLSDLERRLLLVEVHYGDALARAMSRAVAATERVVLP